MNYICAKIRIRGNGNKYRKLLSTEKVIYKPINELIGSSSEYTPTTLLDSDEWFKIPNFSDQNFSIDITKQNYESVDYDTLQKHEFPCIDYL